METQTPVAAPRPVVLYVEDEPINVMLMRLMFEQRPTLQLAVAASGAEAEAMAVEPVPAALLLDLRLPDCHGTELLPRLRARAGWGDIPAVAVTAETAFDGTRTGFIDVWRKPLNLRSTLVRLDALLAGHRRDPAPAPTLS